MTATLLSIDQAAVRLGKSARQVRYMIQSQLLPARKVAGRWLIDAKDLPLSPAQREAVARKERQLRAAVEEGLGLTDDAGGPPRYSVRDLKAFQIAVGIHRQARARLEAEHPATAILRRLLDHLSVGCHRFDRQDKIEAYRQARDCASLAVCELVLCETPEADAMIRLLEQDLMAALAGLLRKIERGRGR